MTLTPLLVVAAAASLLQAPPVATQAPAGVSACGLLPKAEVKRLIGGGESFDTVEPREAPTASGSSCKYSSELLIMVHGGTLDNLRKLGSLEALSDVGDEAYVYNNPAGAVELFARVGSGLVTLSRPVRKGGTFATERPGVIALANALVAKLR